MFLRLLLFLIILFLPTQFGKHFWIPSSQVGGFRLDYLSPTLYFTDLLILSYIFLNIRRIIIYLKLHFSALIFLLVFVSLNLLFSLSPIASLFLWLRWFLYGSFILTLYLQKIKLKSIIVPLSLSVIFIVTLEIVQIMLQSSVGGIFYFLGERALNQSTPQVAKLIISGQIYLRPYATFSHPNSLAGFLLLTLILLSLHPKTKLLKIISLIGIFLSLSKTGIITSLLYLLGVFKKNLLIFVLLLPLSLFLLKPIVKYSDSLMARNYLLSPTLTTIYQYPLFGVGLGGYFTALVKLLPENQITPSLLQPVHNSVLLLLSETGLVGIAILIYILSRLKVHQHSKFFELLTIVILVGGFDHYWLTLPQNKLMLMISLYFVYNHNS